MTIINFKCKGCSDEFNYNVGEEKIYCRGREATF